MLSNLSIFLEQELNVNSASIEHIDREVGFLKDPPFTFACGYNYDYYVNAHTIPYEKLFYSSSNVEGAGLDSSTGKFTAGHPGTYTATWSLGAGDGAEESHTKIFLRKNSASIVESEHFSYYTGPSGISFEQGGRSLVLHLD